MKNGLKYSASKGYGFTQNEPVNNLQAFQGYMPQLDAPSAGAGDFGNTDYSIFGGTPPAQFGGFNTGAMAPGAGNYSITNPNAFSAGAGLGLGAGASGGNWWDGAFGKDGWGGTAISAAGGLASTYLGLKQYGLAKDIFAANQANADRNFAVQGGLTNARLEDRQTRRNIENPNSMAAADYMAKYGVKTA